MIYLSYILWYVIFIESKRLVINLIWNVIKKNEELLYKKQEAYLLYISNYKKINNKSKKITLVEIYRHFDEQLTLNILLKLLNRSLIKSIIMTYGYNKSIIEIIKDTCYILFKSNYLLGLPSYILKYNTQVTTIIITTLLDIFNNKYKKLEPLKALFNVISNLSNYLYEPIYINIGEDKNNNDSFYQYYYIEKYIRIQKWFTFSKFNQQKIGKKGKNIKVIF